MKNLIILIVVFLFLSCFSYRNLNYLKEKAPEYFNSQGFEIIGYEGYQLGFDTFIDKYGGAGVWYIIKKKNDTSGLIYNCYIKSWGNEIHLYDLNVINGTLINIGK